LKALFAARRLVSTGSLHRTCAAGWLVFGLAVAGGVAASHSPVWWRLSICALGMTASPAPWVFNGGMLAVACVFALLAVQTRSVLRPCVNTDGLTECQAHAVTGAILLVAASLAVLALVPYDAGSSEKLVHNFAGWGSGWVVAASMVLVPRRLRVFGSRFYVQTWVALALFMSFFLGFEAGLLTYAQAEIGAICVAALWTTTLFANLEGAGCFAQDSCSPVGGHCGRADGDVVQPEAMFFELQHRYGSPGATSTAGSNRNGSGSPPGMHVRADSNRVSSRSLTESAACSSAICGCHVER
jgi:hypothetical protein